MSMRTTLNIDDDLLATTKAIAARDEKPLGMVISDLLRKAVQPEIKPAKKKNGITLFPVTKNSRIVTHDSIKNLLEDDL